MPTEFIVFDNQNTMSLEVLLRSLVCYFSPSPYYLVLHLNHTTFVPFLYHCLVLADCVNGNCPNLEIRLNHGALVSWTFFVLYRKQGSFLDHDHFSLDYMTYDYSCIPVSSHDIQFTVRILFN